MGHKGHYGQYTGNAKWSKDHANTKVTKGNYKASERDDAAHIDYLKRDIDYDNKHGHSDESMTADEKHISKLAGDMKYDKKNYGSPAKNIGSHNMRPGDYASHLASASEHKAPSDKERKGRKHASDVKPTNNPIKMVSPFNKHGGYHIDGKPIPAELQGFDPKNLITDESKAEAKRLRQEDNEKPSTASEARKLKLKKYRAKKRDAAPKMLSPLNDGKDGLRSSHVARSGGRYGEDSKDGKGDSRWFEHRKKYHQKEDKEAFGED